LDVAAAGQAQEFEVDNGWSFRWIRLAGGRAGQVVTNQDQVRAHNLTECHQGPRKELIMPEVEEEFQHTVEVWTVGDL
jgi:hypothetical protein